MTQSSTTLLKMPPKSGTGPQFAVSPGLEFWAKEKEDGQQSSEAWSDLKNELKAELVAEFKPLLEQVKKTIDGVKIENKRLQTALRNHLTSTDTYPAQKKDSRITPQYHKNAIASDEISCVIYQNQYREKNDWKDLDTSICCWWWRDTYSDSTGYNTVRKIEDVIPPDGYDWVGTDWSKKKTEYCEKLMRAGQGFEQEFFYYERAHFKGKRIQWKRIARRCQPQTM